MLSHTIQVRNKISASQPHTNPQTKWSILMTLNTKVAFLEYTSKGEGNTLRTMEVLSYYSEDKCFYVGLCLARGSCPNVMTI